MKMWGKFLKSAEKRTCLGLDCLPHGHQVESHESVHAGNLALQQQMVMMNSCDGCLEENKTCACSENDKEMMMIENNNNNNGVDQVEVYQHNAKANSSFLHAVINMIGMLIGLGQLSTPYALQKGGWASAFLLVGLGAVCAYSSYLLGKCLGRNPKSRSYTDIGYQAFGDKGRTLTATFIYLEIFMALVSYTISLHDNLSVVFFATDLNLFSWINNNLSTPQILTLIAVFIALPSLWLRDLSSISVLSLAGIIMSGIIFGSVAFTAIFGGVKASNHKIQALHIHNIPSISGLYIFSYAGHIVFPDLYKSMKDPSKFTKVSIVSFSIVTVLYTALAFMGAKLFGPEVSSQFTLSMPSNLLVTKIALWATVVTPMTKYALEFAPFAIKLERSLPLLMKPRTKLIIRGGVGSFLLLVILALALSVPYFEHVLSLTGSLVSIGICLIFPCSFYVKIFRSEISKPVLVMNLSFIAIGTLLGVSGTVSSSRLLVKTFRRAHSA